jgi:D-alanine transaminase
VLARQQAKEAGAQEAIFIDADGNVTEGGATNLWIVDKAGTLVTRPADHGILNGITRTTLMDVAERLGIAVEERRFSVAEMLEAREVFVTGATTICLPVVSIDGHTIANGHPGMTAQKIREAFFAVAEKTAI